MHAKRNLRRDEAHNAKLTPCFTRMNANQDILATLRAEEARLERVARALRPSAPMVQASLHRASRRIEVASASSDIKKAIARLTLEQMRTA